MLSAADGGALLERTIQWLAQTPRMLEDHIAGQVREHLDRRPGEDAWSQTEILAHLADFEVECFQDRIERILRGLPLSTLDGDARAAEIPYAAIHPHTSLVVFRRERERSLARLRELSVEELSRAAMHKELGEVSLASLLTQWVEHDLAHLRQLARTAARILPAGSSSVPEPWPSPTAVGCSGSSR